MAGTGAVALADAPAMERFREQVEPVLLESCYGCHADGAKKGNVAFDTFASDDELLAAREMWWSVLKNVRAGIMPPPEMPRLTPEQKAALDTWIKRDVFQADPQNPDPGRVTLRRLNRTEYRNTIRDLMGIDFRTDEEFPPDDSGYGFDNIGDVLTLSPLLLEKYMHAAETIVTQAVPTVSHVIPERTIAGDRFRSRKERREGDRFSFYEAAKLARDVKIETAGDYRLVLELDVSGEFDFDPGRCRVTFQADDQELLREEFTWHNFKRFTFEFPMVWEPGEHRLAFEIEPLTPEAEKKNRLDLRIAAVRVRGPLDRKHWTLSKNYDRFFTRDDPPESAEDRRAYAREVLSQFVTKAFRRPADRTTVERLATISEQVSSQPGKKFEEGISQALVAVLASPRFLFRVEAPASGQGDAPVVPLDDYALATRLSYFLWSTMPDDELMRLAELGKVRERLEPQVRRMLADERSDEFIENFVGQWLQVRDIASIPINARIVQRRDGADSKLELDGDLRRAMRRESELYFGHIVHEDRSVLELLDSRYTFVNDKLARLYGIPDITGGTMRKIDLPADSARGGILTQAAVLAVTSNPTRTSPVKRGLFVLENILGTPAPPPPPDVPELEVAAKEFQGREPGMRELMELHRNKPLCAACHARMDPLGLGLENFNALGMWRDSERGQPIDTKGQLITGETFQGVGELKAVLTGTRRTDFYRCLTEKVLTFALGRGLDYYDVETVDQIVDRLERDQGRFSALLMGVVDSSAFQKRRSGALASGGR